MKNLYITLDFEEDYGSPGKEKTYFCHKNSREFINFVKHEELKVTLFITGEITHEKKELLQPFLENSNFFEFEQHAYNHEDVFGSVEQKIENIQKGINSYELFFGKKPLIYRAPFGIISKEEVQFLIKNQIFYGSNFFPSFFPGRFNNLHVPTKPFRFKNTSFVEIPFSVASFFRLPIAVSYMQLLGFDLYKLFLSNLGDSINFNLHFHDLFPESAYFNTDLTKPQKIAYYRASRKDYAFNVFKKAIIFFKKKGFHSKLFIDLIQSLENEKLQEKEFYEIFKK